MSIRTGSAFFAAVTLSLAASLSTQVDARPSLVNAARDSSPAAPAAGAMLRARKVVPDFLVLNKARDALVSTDAPQEMEIPFFDDVVIGVNVDRVERLADGVTNYYGSVEGDPLGRAVITSRRDTVVASVFTNGKTYKVRPRGNSYIAQEIDTRQLGESHEDSPIPPLSPAKADPAPAFDNADFIDVMVLYSAITRAASGGTPAMLAEINNGIAVTNSAYLNSGVSQRVRLVHTQEINYTLDSATKDIGQVLSEITSGAGAFSSVAALRTAKGADLVSFWMEGDGSGGGGNGGCGVAWLMTSNSTAFAPNGYSVLINYLCAVDNQSFPHEMGHNMGLHHDAYVAGADPTFVPYAHGYIDPPHAFRTIMAYNNGCAAVAVNCTRINNFSSPTHTYTGYTTGSASAADAARALNESAINVANFKPSILAPGALEMKVSTRTVSEGVGTAAILVSRIGGSAGAVSIDFATADGTASAGTDYTSAGGTLNWADGDAADKTINVTIAQDAIVNGSRNFNVNLSNPQGGATLGSPGSTVVTITDDESALGFVATTSSFTEGAITAVNVPVARTGSSAGIVTVQWATSDGTAAAGSDFGVLNNTAQRSGTLTWGSGDVANKSITIGTATSNIPVINDTTPEPPKAFTITLSSPTGGAQLGVNTTNTVTINDTDTTFQFDGPTVSVNENGPNVTVNVTRNGYTATAQTVNYSTVAGTAMALSDFTATTGTLSFAPGETSKVITIGPNVVPAPFVRILNDVLVEGPETFTINLSSPSIGAALGAQKTLTVTIYSDENGVSMVTATKPTVEGAGSIEIFANRSGSAGAVDVNFTFGGGTATINTHYQGVNGSLHWNDGESGQKSILVNILDDSVVNPARTFVVTLSGATGAALVAPMATTVTIADNDNTVQFAGATTSVLETSANLVIPVSRIGVITGAASVQWSTADGTAISGTDFGSNGIATPRSGTLNWAAGSAAAQNITIPIIPNGVLNGARTFTVSLDSPTGADIGTISTITVTLNDDERGVKFDNANYIINEGTSTAIKVNRMGPTTTAMTATWATVNGTALSGTDFGILGMTTPRTGTVTWGIGDGADKTIIIPALQTVGNQADRSFNVVLTPGAGVTLGSPGTTTVTIQDDDIPAESNVRFDVSKLVVLETVGTAVLTVHRELAIGQPNPSFARDVTVKYSTVPGTALATSDYLPVTNATLHWPPGDSSDKTISINIVNNTLPEPTESFRVVLSAPSAGLAFANPSDAEATISILDDDEAFPLDGVIPVGFSQAAATTKSWHVSNDPGAFEGAFSLKSDEIDDGETAGIEMSGTFNASGTVAFKVKISSEPNFDELRFYIDGVLMQKWSGTAVAGWQTATFPITLGPHTLRWIYVKDGSVSVGMDAAYIDGLVTPSFTP